MVSPAPGWPSAVLSSRSSAEITRGAACFPQPAAAAANRRNARAEAGRPGIALIDRRAYSRTPPAASRPPSAPAARREPPAYRSGVLQPPLDVLADGFVPFTGQGGAEGFHGLRGPQEPDGV